MSGAEVKPQLAAAQESSWRDNSRLLTLGNALKVMALITIEPIIEILESRRQKNMTASNSHRNGYVE